MNTLKDTYFKALKDLLFEIGFDKETINYVLKQDMNYILEILFLAPYTLKSLGYKNLYILKLALINYLLALKENDLEKIKFYTANLKNKTYSKENIFKFLQESKEELLNKDINVIELNKAYKLALEKLDMNLMEVS